MRAQCARAWCACVRAYAYARARAPTRERMRLRASACVRVCMCARIPYKAIPGLAYIDPQRRAGAYMSGHVRTCGCNMLRNGLRCYSVTVPGWPVGAHWPNRPKLCNVCIVVGPRCHSGGPLVAGLSLAWRNGSAHLATLARPLLYPLAWLATQPDRSHPGMGSMVGSSVAWYMQD